mmetsp:Transcript_34984/g.111379  ORF Transcript_34984/g.111379 Transcript_34984/m.111379 type:complete len:460 (-) Transcript_34984:894-2273(-)
MLSPWHVSQGLSSSPPTAPGPFFSDESLIMLLGLGLSLLFWYGGMWRDRLNRSGTQLKDVMAALEHVSEPVIIMANHTISYVNSATLATFGYESKDELEGQQVTILMTQKDAIAHHSYVGHYEKTGERRVIGKPRVVTGRRRDGSSVSLTLAVSPCSATGEYVGILYPRTEMEARATAEAHLATKTNELLESEIERLKLQVRLGAPAKPASVVRDAMLVEAWTGSWAEARATGEDSYPDVIISCLAAFPDALGKAVSCRWLRRGRSLGEAILVLMPGSHAFVKVHNEAFLRLSPLGTQFGRASGHPQLADEKPVLFAGEVEVDREGTILRWSNMSGTYRAEDAMCFQTELALDKFWAVHSGPKQEGDDAERYLSLPGGTTLRRVLMISDSEYAELRTEWDTHVKNLCRSNPKARACYERLHQCSSERCDAVPHYGYLTHVRSSATSSPLSDHRPTPPPN